MGGVESTVMRPRAWFSSALGLEFFRPSDQLVFCWLVFCSRKLSADDILWSEASKYCGAGENPPPPKDVGPSCWLVALPRLVALARKKGISCSKGGLKLSLL